MDRGKQHDALTRELTAERVAALTRIARTLEALIAQLRESRERLGHMHGSERQQELESYRDLHRRATTYRWYLDVQREALGIRPHRMVDEIYRIPESL